VDIGANLTHIKLVKDVEALIEKARAAGKGFIPVFPSPVYTPVTSRTDTNHGHRSVQGQH